MTSMSFSIYLILPAELGSAVYLASNRSKYKNIFLSSKVRPVCEADLAQFLSRLSKCGIRNIPQPYGPQRPITKIALLYLYVDDIRI
jgi:hypothetical protein